MLTYSRAAMKYILFVYNLIFIVTGVVLVGVGLMIKGIYEEYHIFLNDTFLSAPSLLITIGAILSLVAFFGCCVAIQESHCLIMTYSVLLGVLYVMELWVGITGYKLSDDTTEVVSSNLNSSMTMYNHLTEVTELWDQLQGKLQCCGVKNFTEWYSICNNSLPISCCKAQIGAVGSTICDVDSDNLYRMPCLKALSVLVRDNAVTLGSTGICFAFIQRNSEPLMAESEDIRCKESQTRCLDNGQQLLGVLFACNLGRSIGSQYQSL